MRKGYVYLVGAGPGDPKLISIKGLECIKKADVLVYDRLASARLTTYASPNAELIYVGKSPDRHTLHQKDINEVLINKALEGKIVTRLKGGDPFVFGRGGEEALALVENHISFEIVPGISSAIAVPAYAGIPVTHRNYNSSVCILTGNEDPTKENSTIAWDKIANSVSTLVFLMGMGNLTKIAQQLMKYGRSPATPVAIVRWGTRPEQETLVGTLVDIANKAQEANFKNPAVIIVGEVVNLREQLQWFEQKPLFGKRVLVTRAREQASVFAEAIENYGGEPLEFPTIGIADPEDFGPMDRAINQIEKFHWLIFTSVNGVHAFFNRLKHLGRDIRDLKGIKLCAIGPKTKEDLENYGLMCDYVPGEFRAEGILELFQEKDIQGKEFLLPRADIARQILPETLIKMGAKVTDVHAYKTVLGSGNVDLVKEMLAEKKIHVITFTSSSTVRNLVQKLGEVNLSKLLAGITIASIGPITSNTARELGLKVDVEAKEYTIPGLINAIVEHFKQS